MRLSLPQRLRRRWDDPGGYRQLLAMAVPLILSTASWSVQQFVDRMFLTWYSPEAVAAAMPAGILNFTLSSVFVGTAGYVTTFVAQYFGAGRNERIGPALWQGLYVAMIGGAVLMAFAPLARPIFDFVGHAPEVRVEEIVYFRILCLGSFFPIASSTFSGFYAGRGQNWPIAWINALATAVNVGLNYLLIFGHLGFPELGVRGAAIATVLAGAASLAAYLVLVFRPGSDRVYHTLRGFRPEAELLGRVLRYGLPSGVQFFIDVAGFTAFLLMIGRLGTVELAATNIAFNINTLAFMPMIGCGIAVSVLVGQYLGEDRPQLAERSVYSGFHLTMLYMTVIALLYSLAPGLFLAPFAARAEEAQFAQIRSIVVVLLRFVALYSLFDTLTIVFASAIKGAGDTRFVMIMIGVLSIGGLIAPSYLALVVWHAGVFVGWLIVTAYIIGLGLAFFLRFRTGRWRSMRVIERPSHAVPPSFEAAPTAELEP